jgi:hypothetical protein
MFIDDLVSVIIYPQSFTVSSLIFRLFSLVEEKIIFRSINLAIEMVLEKIFFRNQPTRNKNCLWWPCLLKDRNQMNNFNRGSSTDDFYQVSFKLANWIQRSMAKHFQRRRLKCEKLMDDGHL